jgi:hypothetical protein
LLHLGRIILGVARTRNQARQAQAVQQVIDAPQRVLDAKLLHEDLPGFFGPQRTHSIGDGGLGQKPSLECFVLGRGQLAGPTRLPLGTEALQAVIAIVVDPPLHEPPTAVQGARDLGSLVAFQGQNDGAVAISLCGVTLLAAALAQLFEVLWVMKRHLHRTMPPVSSRVCQMPEQGATLF